MNIGENTKVPLLISSLFDESSSSFMSLFLSLKNMCDSSKLYNDLPQKTILYIPSISKHYKHNLKCSKSLIKSNYSANNAYIMDIINNKIKPNINSLNAILLCLKEYIKYNNTSFYFDRNDICNAIDFYESVLDSLYEQLHIHTDTIFNNI
jgi:hypothetical protein